MPGEIRDTSRRVEGGNAADKAREPGKGALSWAPGGEGRVGDSLRGGQEDRGRDWRLGGGERRCG